MRIIRQRAPERFTVVDNDVLEDERLSFRALGVLTYLLSRPDGWETDSEHLAAGDAREGRDAVRTALRQLETGGYLARRKVQDPQTGRWSTVTAIIDRPTPGNPSSGIRRLEIRTSETQALPQSTEPKQPPPPTPSTGSRSARPEEEIPDEVDRAIDSVDALCEELRTSRRAAGLATGRWTNRLIRRALTRAFEAGFDPALMAAALRALAVDRDTATPGRLPHDGPWWTAPRRPSSVPVELDCRYCDHGQLVDADGMPIGKCPHCHPAFRVAGATA